MFTGRRALDVFATEPGPWSGLDPQAVLDEVLAHVPDEDPAPVAGRARAGPRGPLDAYAARRS